MYYLRWLTSKTVRRTAELIDTVEKILNHQRDVLPSDNVQRIETALAETRRIIRSDAPVKSIEEQATKLEDTANAWLRQYPSANVREYVLMFLEIAVLILGSRAFLIQPMVIPTGSAQPTLWGITTETLKGTKDQAVPALPGRLWDLFIKGDAYLWADAETSGPLNAVGRPSMVIPFVPFFNKATVVIGGVPQTLWFVPDDFGPRFGLTDMRWNPVEKSFKKGEPIVREKLRSGDHLFVERVTYNFRRPQRGETIVFRSEEHPGMTAHTHYIKRLVGLGGERLRIGDDRHTYVNGRALTTNDYGFEHVFAFDPKRKPEPNVYSGHVNGTVWRWARDGAWGPTANFPDEKTEVQVRPGHYVCFGDNTMNSADSRYWGEPDFPQERVIGKSCFVFWPFTERWGWGRR